MGEHCYAGCSRGKSSDVMGATTDLHANHSSAKASKAALAMGGVPPSAGRKCVSTTETIATQTTGKDARRIMPRPVAAFPLHLSSALLIGREGAMLDRTSPLVDKPQLNSHAYPRLQWDARGRAWSEMALMQVESCYCPWGGERTKGRSGRWGSRGLPRSAQSGITQFAIVSCHADSLCCHGFWGFGVQLTRTVSTLTFQCCSRQRSHPGCKWDDRLWLSSPHHSSSINNVPQTTCRCGLRVFGFGSLLRSGGACPNASSLATNRC